MPNLFHIGKKFWWEIPAPIEEQIKSFIGRTVYVTGDDHVGRLVEIKDLKGSITHQTKFEVHTEKGDVYLISALDLFAQMNGEKVSKEEIELFDQTSMHVAAAPPRKTPGGIIH